MLPTENFFFLKHILKQARAARASCFEQPLPPTPALMTLHHYTRTHTLHFSFRFLHIRHTLQPTTAPVIKLPPLPRPLSVFSFPFVHPQPSSPFPAHFIFKPSPPTVIILFSVFDKHPQSHPPHCPKQPQHNKSENRTKTKRCRKRTLRRTTGSWCTTRATPCSLRPPPPRCTRTIPSQSTRFSAPVQGAPSRLTLRPAPTPPLRIRHAPPKCIHRCVCNENAAATIVSSFN